MIPIVEDSRSILGDHHVAETDVAVKNTGLVCALGRCGSRQM